MSDVAYIRLEAIVGIALGTLVLVAGIYGPGWWHLLVAGGIVWIVGAFWALINADTTGRQRGGKLSSNSIAFWSAWGPFVLMESVMNPFGSKDFGYLRRGSREVPSVNRPSPPGVMTVVVSLVRGVPAGIVCGVLLTVMGPAPTVQAAVSASVFFAGVFVAIGAASGFVRWRSKRRARS